MEAPLSFTKNTANFARLVWLAFRPTTWTSKIIFVHVHDDV